MNLIGNIVFYTDRAHRLPDCYPTIFSEWFLKGFIRIVVERSLGSPHPSRGPIDTYYLQVWVWKLVISVTKFIDTNEVSEYVRYIRWNPE